MRRMAETETDDRQKFIAGAEAQLRRMFRVIAEGYKYTDVERARLSGFLQAGVYMGFSSKKGLDALMAKIHLEELGETIEERRERKGAEWNEEVADFSVYESPTYERRPRST